LYGRGGTQRLPVMIENRPTTTDSYACARQRQLLEHRLTELQLGTRTTPSKL